MVTAVIYISPYLLVTKMIVSFFASSGAGTGDSAAAFGIVENAAHIGVTPAL